MYFFNEYILNEWMKPSAATLAHYVFDTGNSESLE